MNALLIPVVLAIGTVNVDVNTTGLRSCGLRGAWDIDIAFKTNGGVSIDITPLCEPFDDNCNHRFEPDELCDKFDVDGDGFVTLTEYGKFQVAFEHCRPQSTPEPTPPPATPPPSPTPSPTPTPLPSPTPTPTPTPSPTPPPVDPKAPGPALAWVAYPHQQLAPGNRVGVVATGKWNVSYVLFTGAAGEHIATTAAVNDRTGVEEFSIELPEDLSGSQEICATAVGGNGGATTACLRVEVGETDLPPGYVLFEGRTFTAEPTLPAGAQVMVFDNCTFIRCGTPRLDGVEGYVWRSTFTDCPKMAVRAAQAAFDVTINGTVDDAFQNVPTIIKCRAHRITPADSGIHSDAAQWFSSGTSPEQILVWDYEADMLGYQSIMCRMIEPIERVAVVKSRFAFGGTQYKSNGPAGLWQASAEHGVFQFDQVGGLVGFYDNKDSGGRKIPVSLNNCTIDVRILDEQGRDVTRYDRTGKVPTANVRVWNTGAKPL